ncbi:UNVERIFIED_CONTAM: hypothetical protein GTU68_063827 [Idotea baltica]|nr:hypothetical protein [Idotea baltica]
MSLAVVFPGQGSQSVGMLKELSDAYPEVANTFAEAADVLGTDYWALAQTGPAETLADTRITQPLMFISGIAVWRALLAAGMPKPTAMAGHSLGEFSAMVASGALDYADGLKLVNQRAQLMSAAVPEGEGGMAALIGMDDEDVIALCADCTGDRIVEAVNFNAPGQVAISGHKDALEKAVALAKERGARKAIMLAVSVPNHSSLMNDAGAKLAETIDGLEWRTPSLPIVQNAQAAVAKDNDAMLVSLRAHVFSPVQWTRTVQVLRDEHKVANIIEVGPGKVLCGLGKRIDRSLTNLPSDTPDALRAALDSIQVNS